MATGRLPVVVFIPGFKGSSLLDPSTGRRAWITASVALRRRGGYPLAIDQAALAIDGATRLVAEDVLSSLPLLPGMLSYPFYGPWLKLLRAKLAGRAQLVTFAYDWRRDNATTAALLAQRVERLRAEGAPQVHLIAHSMGGLVSSYYLRYGAQPPEKAIETWEGAAKVASLVVAGTPFYGMMRAFRDMIQGSLALRNQALLDPVALSSMPSIYQLLPRLSKYRLLIKPIIPGF